MNVIIVLKIVN